MMSLIILAGGNATRLGENKAFIELSGNKAIIESTIDKLKHLFDEIIIVGDKIEDYRFAGCKAVSDIIKNKGPLGGIYTGLKISKEKANFVLACDMPFININLIRYMLRFKDYDAVIPRRDNSIEPLHAVYSKNILPIIETQLKNNKLRISDSIKKIKNIKFIEKTEINELDKKNLCFFNINDNEDLMKAKEISRNQ